MDELGSQRHDQFLRLYTANEPAIRAFVRRSGRSIVGFYQWLHRTRLRRMECTRRVLVTEDLL